jgi:hypothetical protein
VHLVELPPEAYRQRGLDADPTGNRRSSSFFAAVDRRTIVFSDVIFVFSP